MAYPQYIRSQLRNVTARELIRALERDGWKRDNKGRRTGTLSFVKSENGRIKNPIVIHYHPRKTYRPAFLEKLLVPTEWDENDLIRVGLIRRSKK